MIEVYPDKVSPLNNPTRPFHSMIMWFLSIRPSLYFLLTSLTLTSLTPHSPQSHLVALKLLYLSVLLTFHHTAIIEWSSTTSTVKSMMSACASAREAGLGIDLAPNNFIKRAQLNVLAIATGSIRLSFLMVLRVMRCWLSALSYVCA